MTILIGLLAGAHTSSWGMYKDAPHEGFTLPKYFRSIVVATLVAIAIDRLAGFGPDTFAHAAVFFGMVYAGERLLTTPNPEADRDRAMFDRLGLSPRPLDAAGCRSPGG